MITQFKLSGLTCPACQKVAQNLIGSISGVKSVVVNLETQTAEIEADREISKKEAEEVLKETHYKIE